MARSAEPALRYRLSPSVDALIGRNGVHLVQGHSIFYLDARAARKLADLWSDVGEQGFNSALRTVLPDGPAVPSPD